MRQRGRLMSCSTEWSWRAVYVNMLTIVHSWNYTSAVSHACAYYYLLTGQYYACALNVRRHITADNASWFTDRGCVLNACQLVTAMVAVHRLVYYRKYSVQKSPVLHKTLNFSVHWLCSLDLENCTMKIVIQLITMHTYKCTIHRKTLGHNSPSGSIKRSHTTPCFSDRLTHTNKKQYFFKI